MPIEHISRLIGHSSTTTTETINRKQIRPMIVHGADIMVRIFPGEADHDAEQLIWLLSTGREPVR